MSENGEKTQGNQRASQGDLEQMLVESIQRYEVILHRFEQLASKPDNNPDLLNSKGAEILLLQEEAGVADKELVATLHTCAGTPNTSTLLKKRQAVIEAILNQNKTLQTTLQGIKSFLTHEIKEIQGGRVALSGYQRQTTSSSQGGIINGSL